MYEIEPEGVEFRETINAIGNSGSRKFALERARKLGAVVGSLYFIAAFGAINELSRGIGLKTSGEIALGMGALTGAVTAIAVYNTERYVFKAFWKDDLSRDSGYNDLD